MMIYLLGIASLSITVWLNLRQNQQIKNATEQGYLLQHQSEKVKSLMKDIVFDLFAPQIYGQTRSLTYSPGTGFTLNQWEESFGKYQYLFNQFINSAQNLQNHDINIREQLLTAMVMNQKAEEKLDKMAHLIITIRSRYGNEGNIYNAMQKDASLHSFFNDFQATYYYFSNSFESFMNYLISSLKKEGDRLNRSRTFFLIINLGAFVIIALGFTILLTRDISRKISSLQRAFKNLGFGNFSEDYLIKGKDEFSELSHELNRLVGSLKENVDNILNLSRDVGGFISDNFDLSQLLELIINTVLQDTSSDAVFFYTQAKSKSLKKECSAGTALSDNDIQLMEKYISNKIIRPGNYLHYQWNDPRYQDHFLIIQSFLAIPIAIDGTSFGLLVAIKTPENSYFSDLGITRLISFAEYVSLTISHFFKYRELSERREAQYQALHSQLQPHFIYNILGTIQGLNRKGDRDGLSLTIDALKVMLRYIQSSNKWSIIEDEIDFIQKYCQLQSIRFGDRIHFDIQMDEKCRHIQIPRLLLQPLVENSIIHGLEPLEEGGRLHIQAEYCRHHGEEGALITIKDNGKGFDINPREKIPNIGLQNVQERLKAQRGSSFKISSSPGKGCSVEIMI